jgi:membrane protease YdiL (CAAX protease family)
MLKNRAFWSLLIAWLAGLAVLAANGRPIGDAIAMLVILGLALPLLALLICRGLPKLEPPAPHPRDPILLVGLLVVLVAFLAFKSKLYALVLPATADPRASEVLNLAAKLAVFVVLPLLAYALFANLRPRNLGLEWPPGRQWLRSALAFFVAGGALVAIQLVLGRGARPLLDGSLAHRHWITGVVLCFLWMSIEAGLVEEVFFRLVLQSRLAALSRSQVSGLFYSALVFGLAHAPGIYLRGAGAIEGLGAAPSLPLSLAYTVATMSMAGLVFGVLWMRTRNWLLIVLLHGLTDALSNAPEFMNTWRL